MKDNFNMNLSFSRKRKLLINLIAFMNAMFLLIISWKFFAFFFIENNQEWYSLIHIPLLVYTLNILAGFKFFSLVYIVVEVTNENITISKVWRNKKVFPISKIRFIKVPNGIWVLDPSQKSSRERRIYLDYKLDGFNEFYSFLENEKLLNYSEPLPMPLGYKEAVIVAISQFLFNGWLVYRVFLEYL